jgi:hypothetical protein
MFLTQEATTTLTFNNDTEQMTCLAATMSNDVTTQMTLTPWATDGIISVSGAFGSATSATTGRGASLFP